ncbi:MAG: hypothetical protein [Olavius algarvensis Delta 4 endosymbiont]|nr:MAG: hypothetical protein [Olavius algarvensis Delta 4 endosymbiont]
MQSLENLEKRLRQVEEKLEDAEGRLPAHSIRPWQMEALFELEEERDTLVAEIQTLRKNQSP